MVRCCQAWAEFIAEAEAEAKKKIKEGTGAKGALRVKAEVSKVAKCRGFMSAFGEQRRAGMEALGAHIASGEAQVPLWAADTGGSVEQSLAQRWTAALDGLKMAISKDAEESRC